ncbi:hypothetical protein [Sinisalibacter aestuarii]|uniref:Uncharacterized protein n=1 Tax=Sinisalibacter aestuarii TaxID=2949426 RepID=A0ABQ5LXW5_9RHOB|nr:hypothetical protein [Sinisalibacter aestuarii]GKY89463.1 hypothetical protein STA1M1_33320 [Sinisalibacter aestuarii]
MRGRAVLFVASIQVFCAKAALTGPLLDAYADLRDRRIHEMVFACGDDLYRLQRGSFLNRTPTLEVQQDLTWTPVDGVGYEDLGISNIPGVSVFEINLSELDQARAPGNSKPFLGQYITTQSFGLLDLGGKHFATRQVAFLPTVDKIRGPSNSQLDLSKGTMETTNLFSHEVDLVPPEPPYLSFTSFCSEPHLPDDPETLRVLQDRETPDYTAYISCMKGWTDELSILGLNVVSLRERLATSELGFSGCDSEYQSRMSQGPRIVGELWDGVPLYEWDKPEKDYTEYRSCVRSVLADMPHWDTAVENVIRDSNLIVYLLAVEHQPILSITPQALRTESHCLLVRRGE